MKPIPPAGLNRKPAATLGGFDGCWHGFSNCLAWHVPVRVCVGVEQLPFCGQGGVWPLGPGCGFGVVLG